MKYEIRLKLVTGMWACTPANCHVFYILYFILYIDLLLLLLEKVAATSKIACIPYFDG
jgi:hypothetical protein